MEQCRELLNSCQRLAVARAWTGASFSYFGTEPEKPTAERLTGKAPVVGSGQGDNQPTQAYRGVDFSASEVPTLGGPSSPTPIRRFKSAVTYLKDL
jgi:hypothetical protein